MSASYLLRKVWIRHRSGFQRQFAAEPITEDFLGQAFSQVVGIVTHTGLHVSHHRADGERHVPRQRPWRRGPRQQIFTGPTLDRELHGDSRFGNLFVSERDLVARQPGAATGTERHDLVPPVQQTLGVELRQGPPNTLHVFRRAGDVGSRVIKPETDAVC